MSKFMSLSAACLALTACQAEPSNEAIVAALFDAFNAHDSAAIAALYTDDAKVFSPEACTPTVGPQAIADGYDAMFQQIPDVTDTLTHIVSNGRHVAVTFTASSQLPGAEFALPIAAFLTIDNGKISEDRAFFDTDVVLDCK